MTERQLPQDMLDGIMTTRAIRRFTDEAVPDALVEQCLRAAQQGPSGGNVQPQQYVVVTDPAVRAQVGALYRAAYDRYEKTLPLPSAFPTEQAAAAWQRTSDASRHLADHLGDVPVLVVFLQPIIAWGSVDDEGSMDIGRLDASVYPSIQNFCLAARAHGLGTAVTTVIRIHTASLLEVLGVPSSADGSPRFEVAALVPLGYPVGHFGVAPRKPAAAVTHWNVFGNKRR
jgi:nitroreductase